MDKITNWVLGTFEDNIDDRDFQIRGSEIPKLTMQDSVRFTWNQYLHKWSMSDCTIFSMMYAACATCNYNALYSDFEELHKRSIDQWRLEWDWRWMTKAAPLIRDYLEEKWHKLSFFREMAHSPNFYKFSSYWYNFATTYKGNKAYNTDRRDNNVIDKTDFWQHTYQHAVGAGFYWSTGIVDSGSEPKKYELRDHKALIKNWVFNPRCYFFVEQKKLQKTPEQYKLESTIRALEQAIGEAWNQIAASKYKVQEYTTLSKIQNYYELLNPIHRERLADVLAS